MIDDYNHLNKDLPYTINISVEDIAKNFINMNYGTHRLLSALVHELRNRHEIRKLKFEEESGIKHPTEKSPLADGIEKLLNQGFYY